MDVLPTASFLFLRQQQFQALCTGVITWFQYRGNKQFAFKKSAFGAILDPNGHTKSYKIIKVEK